MVVPPIVLVIPLFQEAASLHLLNTYQAVFQNNVIGIGAAAGVLLLSVVSALIVVRLWVAKQFEITGYER